MPELEDLMRGKQFDETMRLRALLDEHQWSRRMPDRDAIIVGQTIRELLAIANSLYHLREEIRDGYRQEND